MTENKALFRQNFDRVKSRISRLRKKPEVVDSAAQEDSATTSQSDQALVVLSTKEYTPAVSSTSTEDSTFGNGIDHDIEKGMITILDTRIPEHVRKGNVRNIKGEGMAFSKGARMANIIEFTDEGKAFVKAKVDQAIDENISESLDGIAHDVAYKIAKMGWMHSAKDTYENGRQRVKDLHEFATMSGRSVPNMRSENIESTLPAPTAISQEELLAYFESRIDEQMMVILDTKFETFEDHVSRGQYFLQHDFDNEIEEWITIMKQHGFTILQDEFDGDSVRGKFIMMSDLRKQTDDILRRSIVTGIGKLPATLKFRIENAGSIDECLPESENVALYVEAGRRFNLIDWGSERLIDSGKFNPSKLDTEIADVLHQSLKQGLDNLVKQHEKYIRKGDLGMVNAMIKKFNEFIALANQYGIAVSEDAYRAKFQDNITSENIQAGVYGRIEQIKMQQRDGDFFWAELSAEQSGGILELAAQNGIYQEINPDPLYTFLDEINRSIPRIGEG